MNGDPRAVVEHWRAMTSTRRSLIRERDERLGWLLDALALAEWPAHQPCDGDVVRWDALVRGDVIEVFGTHGPAEPWTVTESRVDDSRLGLADAGTWRIVAEREDSDGSRMFAADVVARKYVRIVRAARRT